MSNPEPVAIIGGGPAGLVVARYLAAHGFEPVVYEQSDDLGGQWNIRSQMSGVWPAMRTNTSRVLTRFSDLDYPSGTAVYPTNQEVHAYLHRYAARFDLDRRVRHGTRVELVERNPSGNGWRVRSSCGGDEAVETFRFVVVATGRYVRPRIPDVPGLGSFTGEGGVVHSFRYKDPERYRGMRVIVAGSAISSLEIAADLAMLGATRVVSSYRRQRYVLPKLAAGVPTDHRIFTRFGALAAESLPPEVIAESLKEFVLRFNGRPDQFGAFVPAESISEAGITLAQHFLPLVAEGRIVPRPWMDEVNGRTVRFADGSAEEVDAIVFGTGFDLSLPFLGDELRRVLEVDDAHLDLHKFTFHPAFDGLAFLGLFEQSGAYFPVLELQARWIAYSWAGVVPGPSSEEMEAGIADCRSRRVADQKQSMHVMSLLFARAGGVEPDPGAWPGLARALLFGPLAPSSFRMTGPDRLEEASRMFEAEAAAFGAITSSEFTPDEVARLEALGEARGDMGYAARLVQLARTK